MRYASIIIVLLIIPLVIATIHEDLEAPDDAVLIEHDQPYDPVISAAGDVLFMGEDGQDVYIMLGEESERNYELLVGELNQGTVEIGVPVNWTQELTIASDENVTINLWNHNETIPHTFLTDIRSMDVFLDGEVISEVPILTVPAGEHTLTVHYQTPPVNREVICEKQTVRDILPPGAQVISSDLDLDTYVQEVCRIRLYHESYTSYSDVAFEIDEIDRNRIVSIYSVENEEYLYLANNSLYVPRR